jgi:hypothetical protein
MASLTLTVLTPKSCRRIGNVFGNPAAQSGTIGPAFDRIQIIKEAPMNELIEALAHAP